MKTKTITRPTLSYLDVAIAQMQLQGWRKSGAVVKVGDEYRQEMVKGEWRPGGSGTKFIATWQNEDEEPEVSSEPSW